MRILFPDISNPKSGRMFFLNNLALELPKLGVEIVFDDAKHDVSLHVIRMHRKTHKPRVLRIDGVYHNTAGDWKNANARLQEGTDAADGVICQSQFSLAMAGIFLKLDKSKSTVIFNGAKIIREQLANLPDCEYPFVAVSKWRPHKRLNEIIESFLLADIEGSKLYIVGDTGKCGCDLDKYTGSKRIVFCGHVENREALLGYYQHACASIHLCWFDSCPNSVVEAICCGCPVITNNVGGSCEIVKPSGGYVLDIDKPYDYFPADLYHPPAIDRNVVADTMRLVVKNRPKINSEHLDIKKITVEYLEFFKRFA